MGGPARKLGPRQLRLVAALMAAPTVAGAAAAAGVPLATARRWRRQPAFDRALQTAGREAVAGAVRQLQAAGAAAVRTLVEATAGGRVCDRIRAATSLLDQLRSMDPGQRPLASWTEVRDVAARLARSIDRVVADPATKRALANELAAAFGADADALNDDQE